MLARAEPALPAGDWFYEPKWDGFRCLLRRDGAALELSSRNERPLNRYFPELVSGLKKALPKRCLIDGELVVLRGGQLDFDALLQRVHPARSRVEKLARETPARFVAFDLLRLGARDLRQRPLRERRELLERRLKPSLPLLISPCSRDLQQALEWFRGFEGAGFDGVIAKDPNQPYLEDKRGWIKVKHQRTADCVIGGARLAKDGRGVASLLLGLYDSRGTLHHVGVAAGLDAKLRAALWRELKPLRSHIEDHPWLHGVDLQRIPGGMSRWSRGKDADWIALRPEKVVEVAYDHLQGDRFRHVTSYLRLRADRDPRSCTAAQLEARGEVSGPLAEAR